MSWHNESRRHALASRGIKTNQPSTLIVEPSIPSLDKFIKQSFEDSTTNPFDSGWILSDGTKIDTGHHHMNISGTLDKATDLNLFGYHTDYEESPFDNQYAIDEEWNQISYWQDTHGPIRYEIT